MEETSTYSIKQQNNENFTNFTIKEIKDYVNNPERGTESSVSSNGGKASVTTRLDGSVNLNAGVKSHMTLNAGGSIEEVSCYRKTDTNTYNIKADDIIINDHKLNNKLIELTDFREVLPNALNGKPSIAGGLTMFGTILVRAWDHNLGRYVLIRRLVNMPMFSQDLGN